MNVRNVEVDLRRISRIETFSVPLFWLTLVNNPGQPSNCIQVCLTQLQNQNRRFLYFIIILLPTIIDLSY